MAAAVLVHETDGDFDEEECLIERNRRRCKTWAHLPRIGLLDELRAEDLTSSDDATTCSSRTPSKETITTDQDVMSPHSTTATVDENNHSDGGAEEGAEEHEVYSDTDGEGGDFSYANSRPAAAHPVLAPQLQRLAAPRQQPAEPQQPTSPQQPTRYAAPGWWGAPQQSQPALPGPPAVAPGWHGLASSADASAGTSTMGSGGGRGVGGRRTKGVKALGGRLHSGRVTTVMVRNLPCTLKQQDFFRELDTTGFEGTYDVCYLPRDFSSGQCKGYGFVNFKEAADAARFRAAWHQTEQFGCRESLVDVSPAHIQGYEANAAMANSSHVCKIRNPCFRRLIIDTDQAAEPPSPPGAQGRGVAATDPGAAPAAGRQPAAARGPAGSWAAAFAAPPGHAAPPAPTSFHRPPCHEAGRRLPGPAVSAPQELLSTRSGFPAQPQAQYHLPPYQLAGVPDGSPVSIFTLGAFVVPQRSMFQGTQAVPVTSTPVYSIAAR